MLRVRLLLALTQCPKIMTLIIEAEPVKSSLRCIRLPAYKTSRELETRGKFHSSNVQIRHLFVEFPTSDHILSDGFQ